MWILIVAWAAVPFLILRLVVRLIFAVVRLMIRTAQASNARQAQLRQLQQIEYELRRMESHSADLYSRNSSGSMTPSERFPASEPRTMPGRSTGGSWG